MPRPPEYDRETVVGQAMAVFWKQGYGKTSIGDLVEATGLQPGSLYAAFGNKKGVFIEVIDHYNNAFLSDIESLRGDARPAIDNINGLLQQIVENQVAGNDKRGCLTVNALLEMSQHDADITDRLCRYNRRMCKAFAALIADAQSEGDIAPEQDTGALATFLMNNIWGMRVMCKSKPNRKGLQAIVDGVMAALRP